MSATISEIQRLNESDEHSQRGLRRMAVGWFHETTLAWSYVTAVGSKNMKVVPVNLTLGSLSIAEARALLKTVY